MKDFMFEHDVLLNVAESVCDDYCKYPNRKDFDLDICEHCPLNILVELCYERSLRWKI